MNLPKHVDVMPELTPCGDVGMVSAYLQALANEGVATALVVSHLPLVGYLVSELCPGNAPDVHHLGYRLRDAGCRRQDVSSSGKKAPATSRWPTPSDGPRSPPLRQLRRLPLHSTSINISSAASPPYSFWCLVKRHNMRMLRQPQRGLLFEDVFPVPVHHAGAKHMLAAAGGN